jgi:hypothetical protein
VKSDEACALLAKGLDKLNRGDPKTLYRLAEARRIFKCKQLEKIGGEIDSLLKDSSKLVSINDIYYGYLL